MVFVCTTHHQQPHWLLIPNKSPKLFAKFDGFAAIDSQANYFSRSIAVLPITSSNCCSNRTSSTTTTRSSCMTIAFQLPGSASLSPEMPLIQVLCSDQTKLKYHNFAPRSSAYTSSTPSLPAIDVWIYLDAPSLRSKVAFVHSPPRRRMSHVPIVIGLTTAAKRSISGRLPFVTLPTYKGFANFIVSFEHKSKNDEKPNLRTT
jgi:hypothetical protein